MYYGVIGINPFNNMLELVEVYKNEVPNIIGFDGLKIVKGLENIIYEMNYKYTKKDIIKLSNL